MIYVYRCKLCGEEDTVGMERLEEVCQLGSRLSAVEAWHRCNDGRTGVLEFLGTDPKH